MLAQKCYWGLNLICQNNVVFLVKLPCSKCLITLFNYNLQLNIICFNNCADFFYCVRIRDFKLKKNPVCVYIYTMSLCLCIPWVLVNSMYSCPYHESLLITWGNVYNISPEIYNTIFFLQKYNVYKDGNTNYSSTEMQIRGMLKWKLHINQNTSLEIQK